MLAEHKIMSSSLIRIMYLCLLYNGSIALFQRVGAGSIPAGRTRCLVLHPKKEPGGHERSKDMRSPIVRKKFLTMSCRSVCGSSP